MVGRYTAQGRWLLSTYTAYGLAHIRSSVRRYSCTSKMTCRSCHSKLKPFFNAQPGRSAVDGLQPILRPIDFCAWHDDNHPGCSVTDRAGIMKGEKQYFKCVLGLRPLFLGWNSPFEFLCSGVSCRGGWPSDPWLGVCPWELQ